MLYELLQSLLYNCSTSKRQFIVSFKLLKKAKLFLKIYFNENNPTRKDCFLIRSVNTN